MKLQYVWVKLKEQPDIWQVVQICADHVFKCGHLGGLPCSEILELGPVVNPPIEVPASKSQTKTSIQEECTVERAEAQENKKVWAEFDPSYIIKSCRYVASQRKSDCGIVALANVAQISYNEAKILCFRHGWSSTKGIRHGFLEVILEKLGFQWAIRERFEGWTCNEFIRRSDDIKGTYLIYIAQHVMPYFGDVLWNMRFGSDYIRLAVEVGPKIWHN